jgi:hypothetical protein
MVHLAAQDFKQFLDEGYRLHQEGDRNASLAAFLKAHYERSRCSRPTTVRG